MLAITPDSLWEQTRRQQVAGLLLQTSLFLALTRTAQLVLVPVLVRHPLTYGLMSDGLHHYHLGLGLLLVVLAGYRWIRRYLPAVFALCLAWLVEEHLVILEQLGWQIPHWYLSRRDNIVVYGLALAGAALGLLLGARAATRP
jgi:hypothetical protein